MDGGGPGNQMTTATKTRAGRSDRRQPAAEPTAKVDVTQRESRIVEIAGWLACEGMSPEDVHSFVQSHECEWPKPSRSQLDSWIAEALDLIGRNPVRPLDQEIGVSLRRLHDLYHRARRIQDYKTALAVERARQDLLGLRGQIDFHGDQDTNQEEEKEAARPARAAPASHRP